VMRHAVMAGMKPRKPVGAPGVPPEEK
jgi:hypothetical protein